METRGLIAEFDPEAPLLRLHGATKVNFFNRRHLAAAFDLPETSVELIETDVGGGFGARGELYPEDYLVPIASRRTGGPVKWIEDRRENPIATNHSRDIVCELEIAATAEGEILGMRATVQGDMGAYIRTNGGVVPSKAAQFLRGSLSRALFLLRRAVPSHQQDPCRHVSRTWPVRSQFLPRTDTGHDGRRSRYRSGGIATSKPNDAERFALPHWRTSARRSRCDPRQ